MKTSAVRYARQGSPTNRRRSKTGHTYGEGFDVGASDMNLLQQPHCVNGHTEGAYLEVRRRAEAAYGFWPPDEVPDFERGYCDGADLVAALVKEREAGNVPRHLALCGNPVFVHLGAIK